MEEISQQQIDSFIKLAEEFKKNFKDRKGYIVIPTINGFELHEVKEDRLRDYLTIEKLYKKNCHE